MSSEPQPRQVRVRQGTAADPTRLQACYQETDYSNQETDYSTRGVGTTDVMILAEEGDRVVGALVQRELRVYEDRQGQGSGMRLLQTAVQLIGARSCYCLPWSHLAALYGRIGSVQVQPTEAPEFLQARRAAYGARGTDLIVMRKSSPPSGEG